MKKFHSVILLLVFCIFLTAIHLITPHPVSAAVLKGVQSGTATLATNSASVTVNITAVDPTKAFLVFSTTLDSSNPDHSHISGQITNANTITFQRSASGAPAVANIRWYVAEFSSGVTVQRGSRAITALNHDIPISAVDTSKSFPLVSARVPGDTYSSNDFFQAKLTSSTNLRLSQGLAAGGGTVEWQVVEFTGANVQSGDVSFTTAQTSRTATVNAVDTTKSWLIYSYQSGDAVAPSNQNDIGQKLVRGLVTNSTTLTFDRNNINSTIDLTWYLVSFTDGTRVQHNTLGFTNAETQKNVTIASVDTSKSLASGGMFMRGGRSNYTSSGSNTDNPGVGWAIHDLTSATNLRITRATTGAPVATASTADFGWFVTTFSTCSAAGSGTYIEAENFTGTINQGKGTFYVDSSQPGFNGTGYLRVGAEGAGTTSPPTQEGKRYRVHFPEPGTYRVWMRMYAQGPSSDSVHIGLNDTRVGAITPSGFYNVWRWDSGLQEGANQITIPSAGEHTINLWIRETDMLIDALYITKGAETPTGTIPSGAVVIDPTLCTAPHPNTISGRVFEDANFAGTASDFGAGDHPLANVEVELYDNANNFIASRTTASDGTYTFWNIPNGTYKVRARTATIGDNNTPPRGGFNAACGITDPSTGSPCTTAVLTWANGAARYGGNNPALDDTTTARNAGPGNSFTTLTVSGSGAANVNFGFAYNLIVNTNDSGAGSLRQFLLNSNAIGNANDTTANHSQFRMQVAANQTDGDGNSWWRISPASALPALAFGGTILDGSTQRTNSGTDTNTRGPEIEINGASAGAVDGLTLASASNTIRELIVTGFGSESRSGILITGASATGNLIAGNYVGIGGDGSTTGAGYRNTWGVNIDSSASSNTIGGANDADRNLISGNTGGGVRVFGANDNVVQGNYIGLDRTGTVARPNNSGGININNAQRTIIGGGESGQGNIISGNTGGVANGIHLIFARDTVIRGNYIGTNAAGSAAVPNGSNGISISHTTIDNTIGGTGPNDGNLISGNAANGIFFSSTDGLTIQGNKIGTNATGDAKVSNSQQGIAVGVGSPQNVLIGGSAPGAGNVLSTTNVYHAINIGSGAGTATITIQGNRIGTGFLGTEPLGAGQGINVAGGTGGAVGSLLQIGGLMDGEGNLIAGNGIGIRLDHTTASNIVTRIQGNTIRNSTGAGIFLSTPEVVTVEKNLIRNNGNNGITINSTAVNNKVYHNTIHGNTGGSGHGISVAAAGAIIRNNIITGSSGYGINASVAVTENYNLVTDASTTPANALGRANITLSPTDINLDPKFVNAAGGDFRLTECSSPAVNTGAHLGADQPDMNGSAAGLFNGSAPDRGALESSCTTSPSDIVIDGNFADWCNGAGNEICFDDAGGFEDWKNPSRLDITRFGIGSNLSDTLFVLMGFNDTSFTNGNATACVLIDTTLDDNINAVLCSTLGSGGVQAVELFTCDNSISGGCGNAALSRTYTSANYGFSNNVAGPWNTDSMIEIGIPFTDLPGYPGSSVILTTLMSYASSSLLKSPKDSIFATGGRENYQDRVLYNIGTGTGGQIGEAGNLVISGHVYADEGITILGSGRSVRLLVNGIDRGANTTDTAGGYFFSLPLDAGNAVLLYLDDAAEKANTATVASTGHLDGVDLYAGHLIVRREGGGNITNANLATAKGASADADILYSVSSGNLNVSSGTLYLPSGHGFSPGGNVTTLAMKSLGTFNGGSGTVDVNGAFTIAGGNFTPTSGTTFVAGPLTFSGGSFSHNSGTFTFDSGNTTTISSGSMVFNDVQFNTNQNATLNVIGTMHVSGNLLITRLAAIGEGTIAVAGDVTTTTDTVKGTGAILFTGNGDQVLRVDDAGGTGALPAVHIDKDGGTLSLRDRIRIWGEKGWKWTAGTVDGGTSTIEFRDTGKTIDSGDMKFNDVVINMSTYSLGVTGTMKMAGNLTISNIGSINTGTIAVEGDVTTTDLEVSGSATILFTGNRDQALRVNGSGGTGAVPGVRIEKNGGTLFLQDRIVPYGSSGWTWVTGAVDAGTSTVEFQYGGKTVSSGEMVFNNVVINVTTYNLNVSGAVNVRNDLTITSVGSMTGGAILVEGNLTTTDTTVGGTTTITLNGTGAQTITSAGGADLPNSTLTINKPSGTATLASALTPTGGLNLTVAQGTLDLAGFDLTGITALTVNTDATLQLQGGETVTATTRAYNPGSTVRYYGDGTYPSLAAGNTYSDLVFDNPTGSWSQTAPVTVRDLTITAGALNSSGQNINLSGNWSNSGTYTSGSNTVTLSGTNQSITGSNTFHNLTKTVAAADTLRFEAGSTTTVNGALTLKGAAGQLLTLASSAPGTPWKLNLNSGATKDISHVNVSWSDASDSHASLIPVNPYYYTDGGDTVAWFGTPNLLVIKAAGTPNANPGAEVTYTVQINNSGNAPALSVVLDGQLSPFLAWSLHAFGENTPFQLTQGDPPSGLSLSTPVYSDDGGATWTYVPTSGGGGAPAGFDGNVTNWKLPLTGEMPAGAASTLRYKGKVK